MGGNDTLQAIMNDVSRRLDQEPSSYAPTRAVLSEMDAFMLLDPLLASLNKEYLDAKHNRLRAEKDYGSGDGMTELAALLEDSAWCAMQTRYMEVRSERAMMAKAQDLMEESRVEELRLAKKERERDALQAFEAMQLFTRMRATREKNYADFWLMLFMLHMDQPVLFRNNYASYPFNRIAA